MVSLIVIEFVFKFICKKMTVYPTPLSSTTFNNLLLEISISFKGSGFGLIYHVSQRDYYRVCSYVTHRKNLSENMK